ncbi:hypothetical protein, partial [Pseudomonas syringae]|uniref:hypothetical protein n=1 Tax=Pseudomonas syringae TaxID=317 RepID=UPI001C1082C9
AEGRKGALSRKQTSLTLPNRCVTQSATKRTQSVQNGSDAERRTIVEKTLFYHDGSDDAECDVSDG